MVEIYFDDLCKEKQIELLREAGICNYKEANWDVIPVSIVDFEGIDFEYPDEKDDENV